MTLYLKYRPQKISDLDLASARETLTNLLKKGSLPHAFLFAGSRGTGKTSSARILAKAINCEKNGEKLAEPCNECETCIAITKGTHIDVIEMDAASNRGIDEIRALKQDIMLAPTLARKKIYIIDEVHMLTTEAANALLKTLEEPPSHVIFILATTDPQKLPQTVLSRLTIVPFHKALDEEVIAKIEKIAAEEKLMLEEGVPALIATLSEGSFRDAVKILEELTLTGGEITRNQIESHFYTGSDNAQALLNTLCDAGLEASISYLRELAQNGVDGKMFLNSLINAVHEDLLKSVGIGTQSKNLLAQDQSVQLLELLLEAKSRLPFATSEFLPIELALIKFKPSPSPSVKKVQTLPTEKVNTPVVEKKAPPVEASVPEALPQSKTSEVEKTDKTIEPTNGSFDETVWTRILTELRARNAGVEALLRAAKPLTFDGQALTVGVYFQFHKERLEVGPNRLALESVLNEVLGDNVRVDYCLAEREISAIEVLPSLTPPAAPDIINAAKEIFGS